MNHIGDDRCSGFQGEVVPNLIWIIIVVLVVLALLGYFGRGRFRG